MAFCECNEPNHIVRFRGRAEKKFLRAIVPERGPHNRIYAGPNNEMLLCIYLFVDGGVFHNHNPSFFRLFVYLYIFNFGFATIKSWVPLNSHKFWHYFVNHHPLDIMQ